MRFEEFVKKMQTHFNQMCKNVTRLYVTDTDPDEMYNLYLDSYPAGTNEIYRVRREYDCGCCRHFIKNMGNVVAIKDEKVHTIWDIPGLDDGVYSVVAQKMNEYVLSHKIVDVRIRTEKRIGTDHSMERIVATSQINRYDHFFMDIPDHLVFRGYDINGEKAKLRDTRNVFKRSLDEITKDAVDTVLELIGQNSLYRGAEWKAALTEFKKYQKEYNKLASEKDKELYAWDKSAEAGMSVGRIRNHSMGTLLVNISEGMDLDTAVSKYEKIVAPENYKRPNAIFTKKMLEDAKKTISELGYMDSLNRRFATLDDITVNNILFSNKDAAKRIVGGSSLFDEMEADVAINPKKFSKVEEVNVNDFVNNILPDAKEIEVYLENQHVRNMVSLIAPEIRDAKTMFKWNNPYSWAYTGNIADSSIKENVKDAGGAVDGVLRFSIMWNDGDGNDNSDLDAHCIEPNGGIEIYFGNTKSYETGGNLDIDITRPMRQRPGKPAVENITYPSKSKMIPGTYQLYVKQYRAERSQGFKAEIEFDGEVYSFEYPHPVVRNVYVADVILDKDGKFKIIEKLKGNSEVRSKEVWGVHTNQFTPVSVVCYSPNYWDEQTGIGHQHLFFMLKDCVNPEEPNGYYNEYLKPELEKHRRVFEALGAKAHVKDVEDQLSGVGFSLTKRAELVVKVKGNMEKILRIKF